MESHRLSLEAPTTLNPYILRIDDTSVYSSELEVTCPQLLVQFPGFKRSVEIIPTIDRNSRGEWVPFRGIYTGVSLGLGRNICKLQDGIYILHYSVSPNNLVYVEYTHLRITNAMNRIYDLYCDIDLSASTPYKETKEKLDRIKEIEEFLEAAKSKVENCGDQSKGLELYNYAIKLLDKMTCKHC